MPLARLSDVLGPAYAEGYAVAGVVVLGWEDAVAYVEAAEAAGLPVILQAGPGCRRHTPLAVLAAMFRELAARSTVPVVAHLDHGQTPDECFAAIDCGFSSVMYDGSLKPLDENIRLTRAVVARARASGVSVEAELGVVGYDGGTASTGTDPEDAARFVAETAVDALAVSAGNVHLRRTADCAIDRALLDRLGPATGIPLVLHGTSGIPAADRRDLAHRTAVCKFNIGTELRQAFGATLRQVLARDTETFDRIEILAQVIPPLRRATEPVLRNIGPADRPTR